MEHILAGPASGNRRRAYLPQPLHTTQMTAMPPMKTTALVIVILAEERSVSRCR